IRSPRDRLDEVRGLESLPSAIRRTTMRMAALLVVILLAADAHGGEKQQCCPSDSASPGKAVATDQKPCLVEAPGAACGDCSRKQCGAIVLCCPAACGTACQSMPPAADRRIALRSQ